MNPVYELARILKERENPVVHGLTEGVVEELPELKIRINEKVVLYKGMLGSLVNLYEQNSVGEYVWKGRRVYVLPFPADATGGIQKFLVLGGDQIGN